MGELIQNINNTLTNFNNPFKKQCIERISIFCYPQSKYTEKDELWSGDIKFKNHNTTGEQNFKAGNINDLLSKMKIFAESL